MRPHGLLVALALSATLLIAACGGASSATIRVPGSLAPQVSTSEAAELRDAGAFVLDVREPNEWAAGHIPGATLIPLGQLAGRASEVPTDRTVLVVCRSGNRSAQGRDILRQSGFSSVTSMAGGMTDWAAAGLPVATGE
jgi:rhodanese-related sulfurtransferase